MQSSSGSPLQNPPTSSNRLGKLINIYILCEDDGDGGKKRSEIEKVLKAVLGKDRYAIYDLRWDQLETTGWAEKTALLVLANKIPDGVKGARDEGLPAILRFLEDGGKLFSWCCGGLPFGLEMGSEGVIQNQAVVFGPDGVEETTGPLVISGNLTKVNLPPSGFRPPMTASVFGKVKGTKEPCILQMDFGSNGGKAVVSQVHFEKCGGGDGQDSDSARKLLSVLLGQLLGLDCSQTQSPEYTIGYLLGREEVVNSFFSLHPSSIKAGNGLTLELILPSGEEKAKKPFLPSRELLPIRVSDNPENFSVAEYFQNLKTKRLGQAVIFTEVLSSTMNVVGGTFLLDGLVAIAARQTEGRARGKNVWLSPLGCASFTLQLSIVKGKEIGKRIEFLEQIAGLAVVLSVPNHKEIGLRVKWPNDIYIQDSKIGGILMETLENGEDSVTVNIGIGFNVANAHPSVSLKSFLQQGEGAGASQGSSNNVLSVEGVIARILTKMESLMDDVENGSLGKVMDSFVDNWIHGSVAEDSQEDNHVRVEISRGVFEECRIMGIDCFGYLRLKELATKREFSLKPDGMAFFYKKKVIVIK